MNAVLLIALLVALPLGGALSSPTNYAPGRATAASSTYQHYHGSNAVDGVVSDASRWLGVPAAGGNWLEIHLGAAVTLRQAHLYTGYQTQAGSWMTNIQLQAWSGSSWTNIAGGARTNTSSFALSLTFDAPVTTERVRLLTTDTGYARLREITLWDEPMPLYSGVTGDSVPSTLSFGEPVMVNQIGYQRGAPKRFTAPTATNGAPFSITKTNSMDVLFAGTIAGGCGDFSAFEPAQPGPYVLRVAGPTNGTSFPFLILSNLLAAKMVPPAVQFMVDARSGVGTHPSAYGGCPWRDGTYYSFEIPSLIYLLLNFRDTVLSLPPEINREAEKARVLDPAFTNTYVALAQSAGFLEALRRYYTNHAPPLRTHTPDVIQCLHFGLGITLERPATRDPSGDPLPEQIHSQTVEWGAYFLHAWPQLRDWIPDAFYRQVREFTFREWTNSAAGDPSSLEIDPAWHPTNYTGVQPYKGRHVPGHSVLPNLLMYEVARREGRADATNFLQAAVSQAQWIVETLDWADPRVSKGHRMSEHKMMPGLAYLLSHYPAHAPAGLQAKIQSWVDTMIARGDNLWDFRRYDLTNDWTIPALANNWNECGNLAGFPACALAAASVITNTVQKQRLRELAWAALDCLFGRNPLNAASPARPVRLANGQPGGFADVECGWPKLYSGAAAYLENARGALCSGPGTEHFPYNPDGPLRWHEPWVNFNAAWNVGLAYLQADLAGRRDPLAVHLPIVISEILPSPAGNPLSEYIELHNPTPYPARLSGLTVGGAVSFTFPADPLVELPPGGRCLLVRDPAAFAARFGEGLPVAGRFAGELPDGGGVLTLGDVNGNTFAVVDYAAHAPLADSSLVFTGTETEFPAGPWRLSATAGGSPGTAGRTGPLRPPLRVMPLGDSITQGTGAAGGYRDPLYALLAAAGYRVRFVGSSTENSTPALEEAGNAAHEGHGGYTTSNLLANLDADVAGPTPNNGGFWLTGTGTTRPPVYPDVVLLMAGVNDLGRMQLPPEQGLAGLSALLDKLVALRPAAWIIVSTLPPYLGTNYPNREQNQQVFNQALSGLIMDHQAKGHRVTLCDIRTQLNLTNAASLLAADGVHPNAAGYARMARAWFDTFRQLPLLENWRLACFDSAASLGLAADDADPDGDGLPNLLEYYHGTSPTQPEAIRPVLPNVFPEAGSNYLSITFRRRQDTDIRCLVDAAPEISAATVWTGPALMVNPPLFLEGGFEQVTFRDTVPMEMAASRFLRLQLLQP